MDDLEREFLGHLREYTCVHMASWGMPPRVHELLSHPAGRDGEFDFGAVIHLRLLDIWDCHRYPNLLVQWRSIAAQLGMIDNDDGSTAVRTMLHEEDRYWWKVLPEGSGQDRQVEELGQEAQSEQLQQAIRRRLEKVKYLLVLENFPDGYRRYSSWLEENFPAPTRQNGCRVVLSTCMKTDNIPWGGSASRKTVQCVFEGILGLSMSPYVHLIRWIDGVASSLQKMTAGGIAAVDIIPEDDLRDVILGSLVYWWLYSYWRNVPVAELLSSWVHAEILPMLLSARGRPAVPPCSAWEVGKNLMAELCRQYLLDVRWGDDGSGSHCWCRQRLVGFDRYSTRKVAAAARVAACRVAAAAPHTHSRRLPQPLSTVDDDHKRLTWTGVSLEYARELEAALGHENIHAYLSFRDVVRTFLCDGALERDLDLTETEYNYWLRSVTLCFVGRYTTEDGKVVFVQDISNVPRHIMEMDNLRMLDLSDTNITSLPRFLFFNLPELRVLLLQNCKRLEVVADIQTINIDEDAASGAFDCKLRVLDLSYSSVREISDDVLLRHMTNLQELILSNVGSLVRPPALRALESLVIFRMTNTTAMREDLLLSQESLAFTSHILRVLDLSGNPSIRWLPATLSVAPSSTQLEEIHLLNCAGLERAFASDVHPGLMILENMPGLRVFTLSGSSKIRRLSLRGCSRLETIKLSDLKQLVELDLSGTGIVELPAEVFDLPRLRRLELLGVERLRRFLWGAKRGVPKELNLNTCSCSFITSKQTTSQVIQASVSIFVTDPRILYSPPSEWDRKFFKYQVPPSFYARISPCMHIPVEDEGRSHPPKIFRSTAACRIPYKAILSSIQKMVKKEDNFCPSRDRLARHVEVVGGGGSTSLKAAWIILSAADSLLLRDHHYTTPLTDFVRHVQDCNLKRCWLECCHNMECIFDRDKVYEFPNLESLWVSKLPRLIRVWNDSRSTNFNNLKLVHLEYCPYIVSIFPLGIHLDGLERLVIRSCPRLEHVFAHESNIDELSSMKVSLYGLQAMELLDLPKLASISSVNVTSPCKAWKLKVRGCWKLRELPTFVTDDRATKVSDIKIDGEPLWRKNLVINSTITIAI